MSKPKKTTKKVEVTPKQRKKRARYDSDGTKSVSSSSTSSVIECEPPVRDNHNLTSNNKSTKLLQVNLKRLSYENLKNSDLLFKPVCAEDNDLDESERQAYTVKECSVKLNRINCSTISDNILKKVYPKINSSKPKRVI